MIEERPVLSHDWILTLDMPLHDDVGGGDVVHVVADQGQVVDVPGDGELPVHHDLGGDGLDIAAVELGLSFTDDCICALLGPCCDVFLWPQN